MTLLLSVPGLTILVVLVGVLIAIEAGRRIGQAQLAVDPEGARAGVGPMEGAIYALLGLLVAFTFSGAAERFGQRRALIVQEANAIGTAYLRLDLLPAEAQPAMRDRFRRYVDARLEAYAKVPDMDAAMAALERSNTLQGEIWSGAVEASRAQPVPAATLLLPALNEMIDITTTRLAATRTHPPPVIYVMLVCITLVSAILAGHGMATARRRHFTYPIAYALVLAVTIYVILDLEYPRLGLIRVDSADQLLRDVRATMR